ncbi:AraC family transcriptional regulator [uncultured Litoreibacter sp.]|uniref:AraC family transcriptional regulator n=1 Tax=uncultured Litoreibacter sp. TaxID=1392394 RepID=UPI002622ABC2|nr:AraC family transcriptional regulator [uncultured Litoreibacter sp.]
MNYEHIFEELEIETNPFALCELKGTCDLGLGRDASATLHYVLSGEGEIRLRSKPPLKVSRGTLVLIPALQSHALHSFGTTRDPVPSCKPAALKLASLMAGSRQSDNGQLTALCAHVSVGLRGITDVIDLIREPLIENVSSSSQLRPALQALLVEVSNPGLGSRAMIRALLMQCMIEMLRTRLTTNDRALHWMAALADPSVWNALRSMLDAPGDKHTVESLADSVGMSRASFAKRFADAYGSGPMELLRDLRMLRAGSLLRETDLPVKRVAELVGFASRSAFTRSFEAKTGQSPRAFRASSQ